MKFLNIKFLEPQIESFFLNLVGETVAVRGDEGIARPDMIQLMMDARKDDEKRIKLNITKMTS